MNKVDLQLQFTSWLSDASSQFQPFCLWPLVTFDLRLWLTCGCRVQKTKSSSVWWWGAFNSNKLYWHNITWLVNLAVSQHINIPVLSFNPSLSVVLTIQATCIKLGCNYQLCSLMISQFLNESIKMWENSEK